MNNEKDHLWLFVLAIIIGSSMISFLMGVLFGVGFQITNLIMGR